MNRLSILITGLGLCLVQTQASAQMSSRTFLGHKEVSNIEKSGDFGLGVQLGDFAGINAKYWQNETHAWDGTLAFNSGATALSVSHLWQFRSAFSSGRGVSYMTPYIGAGVIGVFGANNLALYHTQENFSMAVRVPVGIEFLPSHLPLGISADISPTVEVTPVNFSYTAFDLGARYYF